MISIAKELIEYYNNCIILLKKDLESIASKLHLAYYRYNDNTRDIHKDEVDWKTVVAPIQWVLAGAKGRFGYARNLLHLQTLVIEYYRITARLSVYEDLIDRMDLKYNLKEDIIATKSRQLLIIN